MTPREQDVEVQSDRGVVDELGAEGVDFVPVALAEAMEELETPGGEWEQGATTGARGHTAGTRPTDTGHDRVQVHCQKEKQDS
jgi:hypothetical protein